MEDNHLIKTYVVNMEKDVEKRNAIQRQLENQKGLEYEIVKAVEGRGLSDDIIAKCADINTFRLNYGNRATLPALGCAMSHKLVCEKIISDNKYNFALVLEDDALLSDDLIHVIRDFQTRLVEESPTLILLTPDFFYRVSDLREEKGTSKLYEVLTGYMASGYLINRAGAKLISDTQTPVKYIADDWDLFKSKGLMIYGVTPHVISFSDGIGEIGRSQLTGDTLWGSIRLRLGRIKGAYSRYKLYRKGIRRAKKYWK